MNAPSGPRTTSVLGQDVAAVNMPEALQALVEALQSHRRRYVCFMNVHGLMESKRNAELHASYRDALFCLPDGAPVVWVGRANGETVMDRVCGSDLMLAAFAHPSLSRSRHFLYGGKPKVAELLKSKLLERFPKAVIVGTYTPPFRDLSRKEAAHLTTLLDRCKPDIVWVGLGCPKQEIFMHRYARRLNVGLMLGVGAAFDYHTGRLHDSPNWMKRAGLQWFHRLLQEPTRLWKRYLTTNFAFVCLLLWNVVSNHGRRMHGISDGAVAQPKPSSTGH